MKLRLLACNICGSKFLVFGKGAFNSKHPDCTGTVLLTGAFELEEPLVMKVQGALDLEVLDGD